MSESFTMNRRSFLTLTVTATGALLLRFPLTATAAAASTSEFLTGYLEITPDNQLYLQLNRHEMGQGVAEGLRTLLAEELGTAPHLIRFRLLNVGPNQLNPYSHPENTGGSFSMRSSWQPVRQAGAYCRALLLKAGELTLQQAGINGADRTLKLQDGQVVGGGRNLPFAHLAPFMEEARKLVDPAKAKPLAPPWRYIGHSSSRTLNLEKVTGALQYGYDRSVALVAVIAHPDRPGAKLSHHDRKAALAVPGVKYVEVLQAGVAVVASSTWAALRGRDALQVRWEGGEDLSSDSMEKVLTQLLERNELRHTVVKQGADFTGAPALERIYRLPMLAHAPMEPLACTVSVGMDHCVIHAGTQRPDAVLDLAARVTGIHRDQIQLQDEMSGGSFGRRLSPDYVVEALELGVRLQLPVKVIWDREDQFLAAHFRPPAVIRLRGFAGADGRLAGLQHQIVSPAKLWYELPYLQTGWKEEIKQVLYELKETFTPAQDYGAGVAASKVVGDSAVDGMRRLPYRFTGYQVEHVPVQLPVPQGFWRSVGNALNMFALENFIEEWAVQHKLDPLQLRLDLTPGHERLHRVMTTVAQLSGWQQRSQQKPMGLACFSGYDSHVATVVRMQAGAKGPEQIEHIYCAVDCGTQINPDVVKAQVEGALTMGLSAALLEQVRYQDGKLLSLNFDSYPILAIDQAPPLTIELVASDHAPGGIGETALPTLAPALANAWRLLSGENIASLPVSAVHKGNA